MTFYGFPKVKWLQYTDKVGKCTRYWCQIFSAFSTAKLLKSVNFWQLFEKEKGGLFLGHSVYNCIIYS